MISNAKIWSCDFCPDKYTQDGPRGASIPPVPPDGWALVDISMLIPAHSISLPDGQKQKVGDQLGNVRKSVCPSCSFRLNPLLGRDS